MIPAPGDYSERVRVHFATPAHAGDPGSRYPLMVSGSAAESARGFRVVLSAGVAGRELREVRFRVFGCPHLIAAAEEWCRRVEGHPADSAPAPSIAELAAFLAAPVEKTGYLLLLEDAWRALLEKLDREPDSSCDDRLR